MKTKILKFTALVALFFMVVTTSNALPPVCSITLVDNTYTYYGNYSGHLECWWMNGGIPQKVGGDIGFTGLNLNSLNPVQLDWGLPVETDDNVYVILAYGLEGLNQAIPNPARSAWFNNYYYNNDIISVTLRFN
jgi:hypothetical protein